MTKKTLSIVHVCHACDGAFIVSEGFCRDCGDTGDHSEESLAGPAWLTLIPQTVPLAVGVRVRHYIDPAWGYVKTTHADGDVSILWEHKYRPTVSKSAARFVRVDLEDPSQSAYGYALRYAWSNLENVPGEVMLSNLGALVTRFVAGYSPSQDDRAELARYLTIVEDEARDESYE